SARDHLRLTTLEARRTVTSCRLPRLGVRRNLRRSALVSISLPSYAWPVRPTPRRWEQSSTKRSARTSDGRALPRRRRAAVLCVPIQGPGQSAPGTSTTSTPLCFEEGPPQHGRVARPPPSPAGA